MVQLLNLGNCFFLMMVDMFLLLFLWYSRRFDGPSALEYELAAVQAYIQLLKKRKKRRGLYANIGQRV